MAASWLETTHQKNEVPPSQRYVEMLTRPVWRSSKMGLSLTSSVASHDYKKIVVPKSSISRCIGYSARSVSMDAKHLAASWVV